jgi:hypothetical protein
MILPSLLQDTMARRPDPEEELRWISHKVRGYVEEVLNSLGANVPKVSVLLLYTFLSWKSHLQNVYGCFSLVV